MDDQPRDQNGNILKHGHTVIFDHDYWTVSKIASRVDGTGTYSIHLEKPGVTTCVMPEDVTIVIP
jgi:hypothetical protein